MTGKPILGENNLARVVASVRQLWEGRSHAAGTFTCRANETTTDVTAPTCAPGSAVFITPTTANAAAEVGDGSVYVSATAQGQFTVTHANAATEDRTFFWRVGS